MLIISYKKNYHFFFVCVFFLIKEQTYLRIQSFEFTLQFVHKYIIIEVLIFLQVYCFIKKHLIYNRDNNFLKYIHTITENKYM